VFIHQSQHQEHTLSIYNVATEILFPVFFTYYFRLQKISICFLPGIQSNVITIITIASYITGAFLQSSEIKKVNNINMLKCPFSITYLLNDP